MSLRCIKTGFYASTPSSLFLYGDAFVLGEDDVLTPRYGSLPQSRIVDHLLLRVCSCSSEIPDAIQIDLQNWDHWFDEQRQEGGYAASDDNSYAAIWTPNSTLIASPGQWTWLGYHGKAPA